MRRIDGRTLRLRQICRLVRGRSYSSSDYGDEGDGIPFINLKCVSKGGGFSARGLKWLTEPLDPEFFVSEGDLILANTDLTPGGDIVGSPIMLPALPPRASISLDLSKLVVDPDLASPRFLFYALSSESARRFMRSAARGTTVLHLEIDRAKDLPVFLPPTGTQRTIADYLDAETARIDAVIAKKLALVEALDARIAAVREALFVSAAAVVTPLMHLTDPSRPIVYGIVQAGPEVPDGVPYIKSGDVSSFEPWELSRTAVEIDQQYRRARVRPGDIVVAMRASIGAAIVVPSTLPHANLTQGTARIAPRRGIDTSWLVEVLRTRFVQEQFAVRAVGTTFVTLNIWDLRRVGVPTMEASVRTERLASFRRAADPMRQSIVRLRRQVELLREHRQALITAAVTGEIDVPGAPAA